MRIFSGIQPTGRKHLGNYVGAIAQYVVGQDRGEAIYCIVDLHAITVPHDAVDLPKRVLDTTAILLAAGVDPKRCILFRQSDVPEHTELTWLLCAVTSHGDLNRMNQFREKSAVQRELVSAGLFLYPVLQAADVLVYRADEVPVGDDQRQHIELMRDIAIRFNARFPDPATGRDVLVVPEHRIPEVGARIMDLQKPESKMSTSNASVEGTIYVLDEPAAIEKKFKRAVTDSGSEILRTPEKPGIANLIELLAAIRGVGPADIEHEYADARYGDFKATVAASVIDYLAPVRERYAELRSDEAGLEATLAEGAERARQIAGPTLADVRRAMGFARPR